MYNYIQYFFLYRYMRGIFPADHGNSDRMVYEDGSPHTSHTGAPVPFSVYSPKLKGVQLKINGEGHALKDVSPTVLYTLGIDIPSQMVGKNIYAIF